MQRPFFPLSVTLLIVLAYGCSVNGKTWVQEPNRPISSGSCDDAEDEEEDDEKKKSEEEKEENCEPRLVGGDGK